MNLPKKLASRGVIALTVSFVSAFLVGDMGPEPTFPQVIFAVVSLVCCLAGLGLIGAATVAELQP